MLGCTNEGQEMLMILVQLSKLGKYGSRPWLPIPPKSEAASGLVEQGHHRIKYSPRPKRPSPNKTQRNAGDKLQVAEIPDEASLEPFVGHAMKLYLEFFGQPRGDYGGELGTLARGVARKRKLGGADLLRQQRAAVHRLASASAAGRSLVGTCLPGHIHPRKTEVAGFWLENSTLHC